MIMPEYSDQQSSNTDILGLAEDQPKPKTEEQKKVEMTAASGLSPEDQSIVRMFGDMCRRSTAIVKLDPVDLASETKKTEQLVIASISLALNPDLDFELKDEIFGGTKYTLRALRPEAAKKMSEKLTQSVQSADDAGAHFVCVNELGFPLEYISDRLERDRRRQELYSTFRDSAKVSGMFIIAGTHHCFDTGYNLAALFHPGIGPERKNPILHAKKVSAHTIHEKVVLPYSRFVKYYWTSYGTIAILICLDSYDPTLLIGMVTASYNENLKYRRADVVFVPSYNPDPMGAISAARTLSYLLSNVVVLTNEYSCGGASKRSVFVCGNEWVGERLHEVDETVIYRIPRRKLGEAVMISKNRSPLFEQLLGISLASSSPY
jgi:predicted amidohydrolase